MYGLMQRSWEWYYDDGEYAGPKCRHEKPVDMPAGGSGAGGREGRGES